MSTAHNGTRARHAATGASHDLFAAKTGRYGIRRQRRRLISAAVEAVPVLGSTSREGDIYASPRLSRDCIDIGIGF